MAKQKSDPFDPSQELVKAVIGSAVNIALPGAGSLAAGAVDRLTARTLNEELEAALAGAVDVVGSSADVSRFAFVKRAKGARRKRRINKALHDSVTFQEILSISSESPDDAGEGQSSSGDPAGATEGDADRDSTVPSDLSQDLKRLAFAQLSLAQTEGPIPGSWRDDFEDHLETIARLGLVDKTHGSKWRTIITGHKDDKPSAARVEEWARLVTEAFAVQIAGRQKLEPYLDRLEKHDARASERALFWQLDHQRQAINLISCTLVAIALEFGIHLVV